MTDACTPSLERCCPIRPSVPLALTIGILLLGTLAVADDARAQDPLITFGKEPEEDPNYLEGSDVRIEIQSTIVQEGETLTVSCVDDCPDVSYTHEFTACEADATCHHPDDENVDDGTTLVVFARGQDFAEATHAGEPRWAGTWQVSMEGGTYSRQFTVYLADTFDVPTPLDHYEPTVVAQFNASGYGSSESVNYTVYHDPEDGTKEPVWSRVRSTDGEGVSTARWKIPVQLAERLDCPGDPNDCRRFELRVEAEGESDKGPETTHFQIDPAVIRVDPDSSEHPETVNRTETARSNLSLVYRGSQEQDAYPKHPLGPTPFYGDTIEIDVHLQRIADPDAGDQSGTCGATDAGENITTVTATWTPRGYAPTYAPPRDFSLETGGTEDRFRWALAAQEDAYGNHIKYQPLECFDVNVYELQPTVHSLPDHVERKRQETFVFNFTYADGTPLKAGDNSTQLVGALVPLDDDGTLDNTSEEIEMVAEHLRGGLWVWSHKLPKDFGDLGPYRFEFQGAPTTEDDPQEGTSDQWGNRLIPKATDEFQVKVASPLIEFTTSVDGQARNASEGLSRGDHVIVRARTTYPDGASINASDLNHNFSDELPVRIYRKDDSGTVTQVTELGLHEIDQSRGTWRGEFDIPEVAAGAPLGTWEFEVTVRDNVTPPNENVTRFPRPVGPDILHVSTVDPPSREVLAGRQVEWAFQVRDGDGDPVTDEDTGDRQTGTITVDVRRWDNGRPGEFVATGLEPSFNPQRAGGVWVMQWTPPRTLDPGLYLFSPNGTDIHENPVADRARSRPFDVDIQRVPRDTIVAPPLTVERGENVTVIFDGRDGDTGRNGSAAPSVRLERLTKDDRWVIEEQDLRRANRTGAGDHMATWNTTTSTPADKYRFRLVGRAPDGAIIDAVSETFRVRPQDVTRKVLEPLVPFAKKGTEVSAVVAHRPFDSLTVSDIRISGPQGIADAPGEREIDTSRENWTISWTIPVTAPQGEYVMHLQGKDKFGNNITVDLGPVRAGPVNLTVESLRLPRPEVPRNTKASFVFRVTYPDDSLMEEAHGRPSAVVFQDGQAIAEANLTFDGVNWHATWVPPPDAELGSYRFQVSGRDKATNPIRPLESRAFRVAAGTVTREVREGPPSNIDRFDPITIQVASSSEDRFVEFQLEHYGARDPTRVAGPEFPEPEFTARLSHEYRPSLAAYQVQWTPPKDQNLGWYRITMSGEDVHGNALTAATKTLKLEPTRLEARWVDSIEDPTPGVTRTYPLEIRYPDGEPMTPRDGTPIAFVHLNGRPVEPQPEIQYDEENAVWDVTWTFPPELPPGAYTTISRGTDAYGNTIPEERPTPVRYEPSTLSQLTGATVPGPGAGLAAVVVAVTALAGRSVLSRR